MTGLMLVQATGQAGQPNVRSVLFGAIIIMIGSASALAYLPLQIILIRKWHGGWRTAAALPMLLMIPVIVATAVAAAKQSNLWPILLIFAAPLSTFYLLLLMLAHRTSAPPAAASPATPSP